jgi:hypothetical protein
VPFARIPRRNFDFPSAFASYLVHGCSPSLKLPTSSQWSQFRRPRAGALRRTNPGTKIKFAHCHFRRVRAARTLRGKKMARADEYRRYAAECIRVAPQTPNPPETRPSWRLAILIVFKPRAARAKSLKKARAGWEATGRIRKERRGSAAILDDEQYLELPRSWAWARLTELGQTQADTDWH